MVSHTSVTTQWHDLVCDAQAASGIQLDITIENYLINTLIHYTQRPDIAARIFAIDYMQAQLKQGQRRNAQLREVADQCLLYAGLFPQYATQRNVKASYYVDIGRSAYYDLANYQPSWAAIFAALSDNFIKLMDTLLAIHHIDDTESNTYPLDPIHALQTWQQTQSQQALKILQQQTHSSNIVDFTARHAQRKIKH